MSPPNPKIHPNSLSLVPQREAEQPEVLQVEQSVSPNPNPNIRSNCFSLVPQREALKVHPNCCPVVVPEWQLPKQTAPPPEQPVDPSRYTLTSHWSVASPLVVAAQHSVEQPLVTAPEALHPIPNRSNHCPAV